MKNTSTPQVHVDFPLHRERLRHAPAGREYDLSMPYHGGLPLRGDLVTITAGNHQVTLRVVRRNFELLSGITTIRIDLGRRTSRRPDQLLALALEVHAPGIVRNACSGAGSARV
jgi:hypothetical protein